MIYYLRTSDPSRFVAVENTADGLRAFTCQSFEIEFDLVNVLSSWAMLLAYDVAKSEKLELIDSHLAARVGWRGRRFFVTVEETE